jgi:hypothetical protein
MRGTDTLSAGLPPARDVPKGTTGRVMEMDEIEPNSFELIVEWYSPDRRQLQHDWFTKEEFKRSLIEE